MLLLLTAAAHASDELIVYVFENGSPLSGVDVQLDDQIISNFSRWTMRNDLDGGGHVITVELIPALSCVRFQPDIWLTSLSSRSSDAC